MFSILLGKDEDYIDKQKLNEALKIGDNFNERINPPFVSNEEDFSGLKKTNANVYINDYQD